MGESHLCNSIAALLVTYGVCEVVASPGTRNAPLIAAIASHPDIKMTMVVDERSAAFVALGKGIISGCPVALVCTSGSAMLNYSPALAEALYRHIPLIALTADRPPEMVDRNDGQTIRQPGALTNIVKGSYGVDSRQPASISELTLNDALTHAGTLPAGPVHINVAISDPTVTGDGYEAVTPRILHTIHRDTLLPATAIKSLAEKVSSPFRVMIAAGSMLPDERLNKSLNKLAGFGNFVILTEAGSNLHGRSFVECAESLLTHADFETISPDIFVTLGAPILSSRLRKLISRYHIEHWHIGLTPCAFDTFGTLSLRIETEPSSFFRQLAASIRRNDCTSDYAATTLALYKESIESETRQIQAAPWCEISALSAIAKELPLSANIQLSNGMTIRYAQHLHLGRFHRVDCNRGVSGIDGSTSTAVGASTAYPGITVLFSGDMSARYDVGALGLRCLPSSFKMVVMCNDGGQIFKIIKPTRSFSHVDQCLKASDPFPVEQLAAAWGFSTFRATNMEELRRVLPLFISRSDTPALLAVHTDAAVGTQFYTNLLKR